MSYEKDLSLLDVLFFKFRIIARDKYEELENIFLSADNGNFRSVVLDQFVDYDQAIRYARLQVYQSINFVCSFFDDEFEIVSEECLLMFEDQGRETYTIEQYRFIVEQECKNENVDTVFLNYFMVLGRFIALLKIAKDATVDDHRLEDLLWISVKYPDLKKKSCIEERAKVKSIIQEMNGANYKEKLINYCEQKIDFYSQELSVPQAIDHVGQFACFTSMLTL